MNKISKQTLFAIFLTSMMTLIMSSFAYADAAVDYKTRIDGIASDVKDIALTIIVLSAVFTSIMYMSSFANPGNKELAKKSLYALVCGVFMLVLYTNIAGWIYDLLGESPDNLQTAMNINDKVVKVNGVDVKSDFPSSPQSNTGVTNNPPLAGPAHTIGGTTVTVGDFVGTQMVIDAQHLQQYYDNGQIKYLTHAQTNQAMDVVNPLYGQGYWNSIRSEIMTVANTTPEQLGVIPNYSSMTITKAYTVQLIWEADDLGKLSVAQLKDAYKFWTTETGTTTPSGLSYNGRCLRDIINALHQLGDYTYSS